MTRVVRVVPFFSCPDCSQPQEERNHPASFKLLSPSTSLSVSLMRPPGLYLIHFYTTLRLQPLLSPPPRLLQVQPPRMIKNKSDNLDVLSPLFSLAVLFVADCRKNRHKVRSNRSQIFVLCLLFILMDSIHAHFFSTKRLCCNCIFSVWLEVLFFFLIILHL